MKTNLFVSFEPNSIRAGPHRVPPAYLWHLPIEDRATQLCYTKITGFQPRHQIIYDSHPFLHIAGQRRNTPRLPRQSRWEPLPKTSLASHPKALHTNTGAKHDRQLTNAFPLESFGSAPSCLRTTSVYIHHRRTKPTLNQGSFSKPTL